MSLKIGRDMRFLLMRVTLRDRPPYEKLDPRGRAIDVVRGHHSRSAGLQQASDISQKADGILHVLDYFDRGDQGKSSRTKLRGKILLVEIDANKGNSGAICRGIQIGREHIPAGIAQMQRYCATPGD